MECCWDLTKIRVRGGTGNSIEEKVVLVVELGRKRLSTILWREGSKVPLKMLCSFMFKVWTTKQQYSHHWELVEMQNFRHCPKPTETESAF